MLFPRCVRGRRDPMFVCVVLFPFASLVRRGFSVFDLAIIGLAVDIRFSDIVGFEPRAAPARKPAHRLGRARNTMSRAHLHDLKDSRADDENASECNVYGILVHHHVYQEHNLGEDET